MELEQEPNATGMGKERARGMIDLLAIFRAGAVRRWHTNPDLAHTCDRIDGHSARVARIILALHPEPSTDLLRAALIHDDGESVVGDIPAPAKMAMDTRYGQLGEHLRDVEDEAIEALWGRSWFTAEFVIRGMNEVAWLKFADRLDAFMWAAHHAPHVMDGDGWPEARQWLISQSHALGCAAQVERIMTGGMRHAA